MGPTPTPALRRRQLANRLRRLRQDRNLSVQQVATHLDVSSSKVSRIETADVGVRLRDVRDLLELYQVSGEQREAVLQLASEARDKTWWHAYNDVPDIRHYIGLEDAATSIRAYQALLVPGLLQTERYARVIIATMRPNLRPEDVERRVAIRTARQARLTADDPLPLSVVIDEAVLHRVVGSEAVVQEQLGHLRNAATLPSVRLQVLPFTSGQYVGTTGAFTILSLEELPDTLYLEQTGGGLYFEGGKDVEQYAQIFEQLCEVALSPGRSIDLLTGLLTGLLV